MDTKKLSDQLIIANNELLIQNQEKAKLVAELIVANIALDLQKEEKEKRAAELIIANTELDFQNKEKLKRARELIVANKELDFQNREREKRAAELIIANIELAFQSEEREKRAAELLLANTELIFQNKEKEKRAAELIIANNELIFQNSEKEKRATELVIANKELVFQNLEKGKRAAELIIANIELNFQDGEKGKRAAELIIALKELGFQDEEKGKRAAELIIANQELLVQKQEKERRAAAEAKKDEFFNMVSHEFKTPLTNIKAINQLLEKTADKTGKTYALILNAKHSIKRLERLIEDLLDVTRIHSGQIDLNIAGFDFSAALTNSISNVQLGSAKHAIILENTINTTYAGDQFRIEQVLINLLNNAIKYSPNANKVLVNARVESGYIIVNVEDFGIGIEKADMDQLFDRFYRVSKTAMLYQGVGLGLFIASEIIKKHNGRFTVKSEPGKGSSFSFLLPLNPIQLN
ncbi:MAG: ATP-binding protein [Bacteroidota bacterium]